MMLLYSLLSKKNWKSDTNWEIESCSARRLFSMLNMWKALLIRGTGRSNFSKLLRRIFLLCWKAAFKNVLKSPSSSIKKRDLGLFLRETKAESTFGGGEKQSGFIIKWSLAKKTIWMRIERGAYLFVPGWAHILSATSFWRRKIHSGRNSFSLRTLNRSGEERE